LAFNINGEGELMGAYFRNFEIFYSLSGTVTLGSNPAYGHM